MAIRRPPLTQWSFCCGRQGMQAEECGPHRGRGWLHEVPSLPWALRCKARHQQSKILPSPDKGRERRQTSPQILKSLARPATTQRSEFLKRCRFLRFARGGRSEAEHSKPRGPSAVSVNCSGCCNDLLLPRFSAYRDFPVNRLLERFRDVFHFCIVLL